MPKSEYYPYRTFKEFQAAKIAARNNISKPVAQVVQAVQSIPQALGLWDQPDPNRILGIDTSHWTGIVDWQKAKANGIQFAVVKALDGAVPVRFMKENYAGCKAAGIPVSFYTWLYRSRPGLSTDRQASEFAAILKDYPVDFAPTVDFEPSPLGSSYNAGISDLYGFLTKLAERAGVRSMIYTGYYYWQEYGSRGLSWADYPLWIAAYKTKAPRIPQPWKSELIWQWTESGDGMKYGIPRDGERGCDLNYLNGTLADLRATL